MSYEEEIRDLVYFKLLLITGGARKDFCKNNIARIMWSIPDEDLESVKYEVNQRVVVI